MSNNARNDEQQGPTDDQSISDWSASDQGRTESLETLNTDQSRPRTPPLVTRSRAKQGSPSKQLSTTSYQGSRFKTARTGKSTGIELGDVPADTQRKLEVVTNQEPRKEITVTLSEAEYLALLSTRDLTTPTNAYAKPAIKPSGTSNTHSDVVVPAFLRDNSHRSVLPPLSGNKPDAINDVVEDSKKRKRTESVSDIPDFLQHSTGDRKKHESDPANMKTPFHDDSFALRVNSLPHTCEVTSLELQDVNCRHTYKDLPNLRKGTFASWNSTPGDGLIVMSALPQVCKSISREILWSAFLFRNKGHHINLSRVDPRILQAVAPVPPGGQTKFTLSIDNRTALCVSVCVVDKCALSTGTASGNARRQKFLSGILFSQEFQRLVAVCCMVFSKDVLHAPLALDALTFGTGLEPASASPVKKGRVAPGARQASTSTTKPMVTKDMLRFEDEVPIYDGRNLNGKFEDYVECLYTLPAYTEHDGEVATGSVVAVGYTVNQYESSKKKASIGFNINWVLVLGEPLDS